MTTDTAFGMLLPTRDGGDWDARQLIDFAVEAERIGFTSVWASESAAKARHEPLTLLAAVSIATDQIELGTAALMPTIREPVSTARAIASLDQLCRGRLVLGLGAGFPNPATRAAFAMANINFRDRSARLDETVALWRHLWSEHGSDPFHGEIFSHDWLPEPFPTHRLGGPPMWLAAGSAPALERVGRVYDGWLPYPPSPLDYASGIVAIEEAAEAAGRHSNAIVPSLFATIYVDPDVENARRISNEYCMAIYGLPLEVIETIQVWLIGSPEHVGAGLDRYIAAGARHIVVRIGGLDPTTQFEPIADLLFNSKKGLNNDQST